MSQMKLYNRDWELHKHSRDRTDPDVQWPQQLQTQEDVEGRREMP